MPSSSSQPHDPFIDAPLRQTTSNTTSLSLNPTLRSQTSQHSLRSNASNASGRNRQQRDLFAPSLTRRGTTPRYEDEVLADSDSEQDRASQRQKHHRRVRHGSPARSKGRQGERDREEQDFVNRKADGSYLLGVTGFGDTVAVPQMSMPRTEMERELEVVHTEVDAHYTAIARQFFTSGASLGGKSSKKHEEELEQLRLPMMMRLREKVMQELEDDRWKYESSRP